VGIEINKTTFSEPDYTAFREALEHNLADLEQLLGQPGFGVGPASLGAELELYIVDVNGNPLHANQELLSAADDPQLTLELNRYNLEYNLLPRELSTSAFEATENEILNKLADLRKYAARIDGRIVATGILPTLQRTDFGSHCITNRKRYHALIKQLLTRRGGDFRIDINGENPLQLNMSDITLEGANTSFQVHYRVDPQHFADTFNALQLMTPLALAIGANSPTLFGHKLWHETRIPLFKQSIDTRNIDPRSWKNPARVCFGQGWVRESALELFTEVVRIYPPLLPICEDKHEIFAGYAPSLSELRLHQSTVWSWNRPVYDPVDGGHLRIEMRSLPAGPTPCDMVANAAFLIGLAEGIKPQLRQMLAAIPFGIAEYNFYRAAEHGLQAQLVWPQSGQSGYREQSVCDVIEQNLPLAAEGLARIGVGQGEIDHYLNVISERLTQRRTGASWQLTRLAALEQRKPLREALHSMLEEFMMLSENNIPVAQWPL
jgi:gamma-glutamyl:cysteine ligase YbdK (ATP-grasp superfamily)